MRRRLAVPAALAVTLIATASGCPESDDPPLPDASDAQVAPVDARVDGPDIPPPPFD